LERMIS